MTNDKPIDKPELANYHQQIQESKLGRPLFSTFPEVLVQGLNVSPSNTKINDIVGLLSPSVVDIPHTKVHDAAMNGLTREELDAKLDARDAKADARMSRFEERIEQAIGEMRRDSSRFEQSVKDLQSEIRSSQKSTISLVIGSALAIFFGIAGVNYSLFSVFDSGRETGAAIEKATSKLDNVVEEIKKDYQNTQKKMDELESKILKPAP